MSLSLAETSYLDSISQWIANHRWVGSGQQQSVLVVQVDGSPEQYHVQSGFGLIEVGASYTPGADQLDNLTVLLDIPEFGPVLLVEASTYPLSDSPGQNLTVSIAEGAITGDISFRYVGDSNDTEVFTDYTLSVPFSDTLEESPSFFPVDIQRAKTVESSQSSNTKRSEARGSTRLRTRSSNQDKLVASFLSDYAKNNELLIDTYYPEGTNGTAPSKEYTAEVTFLGIFNLVGPVDLGNLSFSWSLFIKLPIIGKVRIIDLQGGLRSGVTGNINTPVAKGTVAVSLEGKDVYVNTNVVVQLVGNVVSKVKLFTLP